MTKSSKKQGDKEDEITLDNLHEFVTVEDCNLCPETSGCSPNPNPSFLPLKVCICTHHMKPMRVGKECERKVVTTESSLNNTNNSARHSIPVMTINHFEYLSRNTTRLSDLSEAGPFFTVGLSLSVFIASILSLFLLSICLMKRRSSFMQKLFKSKASKRSKMEMEMDVMHNNMMLLLPTDRFVNNPTYDSSSSSTGFNIRIFTSEEVKLLSQIGQGCFGKVFKGELGEGSVVAIKVVKKDYADEAMKEVETMATFSHPNILRLIGILRNSDSDVPWLIFEYMRYGDLASVLRSEDKNLSSSFHKGEIENGEPELEDNKLEINTESLLFFASQIAEGMKYLASQHFVHRDLAARNCLVSASGAVKISDFGLSRDVYTCDYYKIGGSRLLPLRWMAPESILYGRFTLETDVWAYGVLLWEIFTWGKQPYFGHNNEEVVQLILDGVLLCPPSDCPPTICQVMEGCWKTDAKHRLTFVQIVQKLCGNDKKVHDVDEDEEVGESEFGLRSSSQPKPILNHDDDNDIQMWIESGYEIPRCVLREEYLKVV